MLGVGQAKLPESTSLVGSVVTARVGDITPRRRAAKAIHIFKCWKKRGNS
jgi:hypothetical protein